MYVYRRTFCKNNIKNKKTTLEMYDPIMKLP